MIRRISVSLMALAVYLFVAAAQAQVVIKLGTIAPEGSIWHDALLEIRQQWQSLSDGEVELRIYAGGVLGGEDEMVRKMQRRSLDALAISGSGLPLIDDIVSCLNLPLLFNSYDGLDVVRQAVSMELEQSFEAQGYKILSWAEAGWVHFFAKSPVQTPDDLRELRLWISTGKPDNERLLKQLGFRVVPLPATDMLMGLQTGLIEAIDVPPLFALLDRSYQVSNHMTVLRFAPLNAATVMTLRAWQRIPPAYREEFLFVARDSARRLRQEIRTAEQEAIDEMVARGLNLVELNRAQISEWERTVRSAYSEHACSREHPVLFEKVMRLQGENAGTAE